MRAPSLIQRARGLRARPLTRRAKAAAAAAGAAAWSAVILHEGKAVEETLGRGAAAPERRKTWLRLLKDAYNGWSVHQISRFAASLAYFTMFSIAPLVLIMIAVVGLFFGQETAQRLVTQDLQGFLGADKAKALHSMVMGARKPGAGGLAGIIGIVTLLVGASSVVGELQSTLNEIFGVPPVAKSLWTTIRRRIVSLGFVLGMGFLLLVSLAVSTGAAAAGKYLSDSVGFPPALMQVTNQILSFGVITLLFVSMYRFLPDARAAWKDLWIGGAFTAALFTVGNLLLGLYLGKAGPTSAYGAAGSLLAFILWTYYCAQIIYFGAEFTEAYAAGRGHGIRKVLKA
jgi:membrane protein